MPDWSSPREIARDMVVFEEICLAALGLYTWEVIIHLPFDWSIISRKREVHWPAFLYLYCKYSLFFGTIGITIANNVTTKVNCQALYVFIQFTGFTTIGSASTLLMLRTIAVWNRVPLVTVPLVLASMGQWGLLLHGIVIVRSSWSDVARACVVNAAQPVFMEAIYLYTMSLDLIVLLLTVIGLAMSQNRSSLWQLLFRQGIIYFFVAFIANLLPAIFLVLNLNPIMNLVFSVPAAVASSIVACRSFVSLTNFRQKVYVHRALPHSSTSVGTGESSRRKVIQARAGGVVTDGSDSSPTRKWGGAGNTIATTLYRGMGTGVQSLGQTHKLGCGCDVGGPRANSQVLVHVVHDCDGTDVVNLEMLELSSDTPTQKSFVPDV